MAAFPYDELRIAAAELIRETGRELVLRRLGTQTLRDPLRPQLGYLPAGEETLTVMGTFVSTKSMESQFGFAFISEDFVRKYAEAVLIANEDPALHSELETYDAVLDEGKKYVLESCQKLRPGTMTMLYAFGVKR